MTNYNFIIKESSLLKKVVANVAILPNSSVLTFTSGESIHKLWPGKSIYNCGNRLIETPFIHLSTH